MILLDMLYKSPIISDYQMELNQQQISFSVVKGRAYPMLTFSTDISKYFKVISYSLL